MQVIFGNYGNNTIALLQHFATSHGGDCWMVSVDTGWGAHAWQERVTEGEALARKLGYHVQRLKLRVPFPDLMRDRQRFPSKKFQWCAGFLKGLPFLQWLDEVDPRCEAEIMLPVRRSDSPARKGLPASIDSSEHFGERRVVHPLLDISNEQLNGLIQGAGFAVLSHRSLECEPCVNSQVGDCSRMQPIDMERTAAMELELQQFFFPPAVWGQSQGIRQVVDWAKTQPHDKSSYQAQFDMGCGTPYGCGD